MTSDPSEGPRLISDPHPVGVPIMVLVKGPSCCTCKLDVPDGIATIEERNGVFQGLMAPGCHCGVCAHRRIAAMITLDTIRFNAPVNFHLLILIGKGVSNKG